MKVERVEEGFVIDQAYLSFADVERICAAIDDTIAWNLPSSAETTQGVVNFILKKYKKTHH